MGNSSVLATAAQYSQQLLGTANPSPLPLQQNTVFLILGGGEGGTKNKRDGKETTGREGTGREGKGKDRRKRKRRDQSKGKQKEGKRRKGRERKEEKSTTRHSKGKKGRKGEERTAEESKALESKCEREGKEINLSWGPAPVLMSHPA